MLYRFFKLNVLNTSWAPGRRVNSNAVATRDSRRRDPLELQPGMHLPIWVRQRQSPFIQRPDFRGEAAIQDSPAAARLS
jgi:hypothetical protein